MRIIVRTNPGIEDIACEELRALSNAESIEIRRGRIIADVNENEITNIIEKASMIHGVSVLLYRGTIPLGKDAINIVKEVAFNIEWEKYITWGSSFAVRSERVGSGHEYTSVEIASAIGEGIVRRLTEQGVSAKVYLKAPCIVVYADVIFNELFLSVSIAGDVSLHRRWYRVEEHMASLKPSLASAMLWIAGARDGMTILDPVCGSGTIAIEAALQLENARIICNDISKRSIRAAIRNALAARVRNKIVFMTLDAGELSKHIPEKSVDRIICNPPYGIRLGSPETARRVLSKIFRLASDVLTVDGKVVMITPDRDYAKKTAENRGLKLFYERAVKHGDLDAWILGFTR